MARIFRFDNWRRKEEREREREIEEAIPGIILEIESPKFREKNRTVVPHRFTIRFKERAFASFGTVVCEGGWLRSKPIDTRTRPSERGGGSRDASAAAEVCRHGPRRAGRDRGAVEKRRVVNDARPLYGFAANGVRVRRARLCVSKLAFYAVKCPPSITWTCVGCVSWRTASPCRSSRARETCGRSSSRSLPVCRSR